MKKVIDFGKIDFNSVGRKINRVTVDVELRNEMFFSVCADVWNSKKTDCIVGGQCLDDIYPFLKDNKLFKEIYRLWKSYHLNDLKPGTPEQMECIKNHKDEIDESLGFYEKELSLLRKYNLDVVEYEGQPYKYGTKWLYQPIPEEDLNLIKNIISGNYE